MMRLNDDDDLTSGKLRTMRPKRHNLLLVTVQERVHSNQSRGVSRIGQNVQKCAKADCRN